MMHGTTNIKFLGLCLQMAHRSKMERRSVQTWGVLKMWNVSTFFFPSSYISGRYLSPTWNTEKRNNTLSKQLPMLLKHPSNNINRIILATKIAIYSVAFRIFPCSNNGIYRREAWGARSGFVGCSTLPRFHAVTSECFGKSLILPCRWK